MVVVPAGSFRMGDPRKIGQEEANPVHEVRIADAFAIGKFEVTFGEWDACVEAGGCSHKPSDQEWGRETRPVMSVNWEDAKEYVSWLTVKTGHAYRLPSEAEWEYAARAGTTSRYHWGDTPGSGNANCHGCGSPWDKKSTAPVGSFAGNRFGIHDVHGNVWEWIEDCWHDTYDGAPSDGNAWTGGDTCDERVMRGGAFINSARIIPSAARSRSFAEVRIHIIGFRVARTLAP